MEFNDNNEEYKEYTDISPHSDKKLLLKSLSISKEAKDNYPKEGDICEILYSGYSQKTKKLFFSNEMTKEVKKYELGRNLVIKGLELALMKMKKTEKIHLHVSSSYAYGKSGFDKYNIDSNEDLDFYVTLIDFYNKDSFINAKKQKEEAVEYFKKKDYKVAIKFFNTSLEIIEKNQLENKLRIISNEDLESKVINDTNEVDNSNNKEVQEFKLTLLLNLGNCYYKEKEYEKSVKLLKDYISINKKNPKAYYFKGLGNCELCYLKENVLVYFGGAKRDYLRLIELLPANEPGVIELREKVNEIESLIEKFKKTNKDNDDSNINIKPKIKIARGLYDDKQVVEKSRDIPVIRNPKNPVVFFDIQQGSKKEPFRVEFELFEDVVPKTTENFRVLCTGEKEGQDGFEKFTYVGTRFHRIIKDFIMQGGDFENGNGTGGYSIYGKEFDDENFKYNHSQAGVLSMANSGINSNGSQFFITFSPCAWLNGKHVVFGRVISGLEHLKILETEIATDSNDVPLEPIEIISAGEIFN